MNEEAKPTADAEMARDISPDADWPKGPATNLVQITLDELAEFEMLRTVLFSLMMRMSESRGKNVSVRFDNIFAVVPEVSHSPLMIGRLTDWFNKRIALHNAEAEAKRLAMEAAKKSALEKLTDEERAALGV